MGRMWICAILALLATSSAWAVEVHDVRLWRAPDHTRIVFDLTGPAEHKLMVLQGPDRIVIDVQNVALRASLAELSLQNTPIKVVRSAVRDGDDLRVVFELSAPVDPRSFALQAREQTGDRLVVDLYDLNAKQGSPVSGPATSSVCGRFGSPSGGLGQVSGAQTS